MFVCIICVRRHGVQMGKGNRLAHLMHPTADPKAAEGGEGRDPYLPAAPPTFPPRQRRARAGGLAAALALMIKERHAARGPGPTALVSVRRQELIVPIHRNKTVYQPAAFRLQMPTIMDVNNIGRNANIEGRAGPTRMDSAI